MQRYTDQTRQTERADERQALRPFLRQYLEGKGIDTSKNFRCLNPNHPDRHPSAYYTTGHRVICRACGAQFDIFDLVAMELGRPAADRSVFEEVRRRYGQGFSFSPAAAQTGSSSGGNSPQCLDWNDRLQAYCADTGTQRATAVRQSVVEMLDRYDQSKGKGTGSGADTGKASSSGESPDLNSLLDF